MGYEVAGALGAKMASPDTEVYSILGDGSFLMLHTELVTALQYNKKINVVVFDNSGFGCINNLQMANGCGSFYTEFRDYNNEVMNIHYADLGRAYGAVGYTVTNKEELEAALADAKNQQKSTVIEIKVLPKTMTNGYENWWRLGVSEVGKTEKTEQIFSNVQEPLKNAKGY
ncbi:3D-(3,5/4)-trihydroxycyclohexane-1,2-dione hydrolase [compost metagenome]